MNWFVWRQHRKQYLAFGLLLAAFAALLIPTGIHYWSTYQHAVTTCAQNPATPSCNDLQDTLFTSQMDGFMRIAVVLGTFGLPVLVGMFLGSPFIAREYEEGTNKLIWTQSVSRRRWLTIKLLWTLSFVLLYGIALTLLTTWWSRMPNALAHNRFVQGHFETQGLMPAVYTLFFTAIGVMASALSRKTLVSVAATIVVFVACTASFAQWIRPHYMSPVTVTAPMGPGIVDQKVPADAWVLKHAIVDKNGKTFDRFMTQSLPQQCQDILRNIQTSGNGQAIRVKAGGGDPVDECLNQAGYHQVVSYQPAYRYWDFQRIEAGIYLGATVLALGATYIAVLKRDA
jgi:hypothetical protein